MIITRTPFRISFFGGGTDYPNWYKEHGGSVLSATIDKYCYISARYLPPFFEHRFRIVYSQAENCNQLDEIKHPAIRETLRFLNYNRGMEIHHDGDLPARSGMGSSSSFTVGLLNALYALRGRMVGKHQLATESIHIEQEMIREAVGSQDQVAVAFGGVNHITFSPGGEIGVQPLVISRDRLSLLDSHLMLFFTGINRTAATIAETFVNHLQDKRRQLRAMKDLVDESISILSGDRDLFFFGDLLNEAWTLKKSFSEKVSNPAVDDLYNRAIAAGAIGGKLTGAGGGGFLLLFVPPERQTKVREALKGCLHVPFHFEHMGSQVVFYDPQQIDYSAEEKEREISQVIEFKDLNKSPTF